MDNSPSIFFFMSNAKFRDIFHFIIQFECLQRCKPCNLCNGVLITLTKVFFCPVSFSSRIQAEVQ